MQQLLPIVVDCRQIMSNVVVSVAPVLGCRQSNNVVVSAAAILVRKQIISNLVASVEAIIACRQMMCNCCI